MRRLLQRLRPDSGFWRKLAWYGAARGPRWLQRWSPAPIGLLFASWPGRKRSALKRNLRRILGDRSVAREGLDLARSYMCFAHSLADSLAVSSEGGVASNLDAVGVDHLRLALEQGRGVILGTAHTAGWEVSLAALRHQCPAPIAVVMQKERDDSARALHSTLRAPGRLRVIEVGDDPLASLPLISHLRQGGILALQVDRCPPGIRCQSASAEGVAWRLPAGPFVLSATTGAPILLVLTERCGFRSYRLRISEPIRLPRRPSVRELGEAADRVAGALSQFVRSHPTQWFGFED